MDWQRARTLISRIDAEADEILADPVKLVWVVCNWAHAWGGPPLDSDAERILPVRESPRASVLHVVAARLCGPEVDYRVVEGQDGTVSVIIKQFR